MAHHRKSARSADGLLGLYQRLAPSKFKDDSISLLDDMLDASDKTGVAGSKRDALSTSIKDTIADLKIDKGSVGRERKPKG
jgi:hypothetical protein